MEVEPLDATFGAVVRGVRLAALSESEFAELYRHWLGYALLVFPGQQLNKVEQEAFATRFGELEFPVSPISNVRKDGSVRPDDGSDTVVQVLKGNMGWHHDSTYMPIQAKGAVFTAHVVPDAGGETAWADMRAAFDALDELERTRVEDLAAYHSLYYSQARLGHEAEDDGEYSGYGFHGQEAPLRPLVKVHPETGRKNLVIGRHAYGIPGLGELESETLLDELMAFACQPPRTYQHRWTAGDAVLWDNRCLMHQACPWEMSQPRVMYHARIAGDPVTESAAPTSDAV